MADTKSKSKPKSNVEPKLFSKPKASSGHKTASKSTSNNRSGGVVSGVTFKCRLCEKQKPISEMKIIKRFRPVIFVCQDCEKTLQ